jgi:phosphoglycerate dehydrogenase-like enzyme
VHAIEGLPELLLEADVVVLILPLTNETRGLVDAQLLERMKDGALLVNAARGPVVDTGALVAALSEGRIRAALDVTDPEPLPEGHPLWSTPNTLITPHVGGDTPGFRGRAYKLVGDQLRRYAAGEPLINVVEGEY